MQLTLLDSIRCNEQKSPQEDATSLSSLHSICSALINQNQKRETNLMSFIKAAHFQVFRSFVQTHVV